MLLFSVNPSVCLMFFLDWALNAGVHSPHRCSEHLGLHLETAPKWIWQDPHLVGFPRNKTFSCHGLQGSVGAEWTGETFPAAWQLLQGLLEQSPCWGWLSSWWQHMAAREGGKSTGKCSPETWVSAWQDAACCSIPQEKSQTLLLETHPASPCPTPLYGIRCTNTLAKICSLESLIEKLNNNKNKLIIITTVVIMILKSWASLLQITLY